MSARTLRQLLEERIATPPFVVFPLLPRGGKLFLYAPKKHYKSMLLYNVCYDFAEGLPILGRWAIAGPLPVLLIEQEIGAYMTRQRFGKIHQFRGGSIATDNITIISKERSYKLDTPEGFEALRQIIAATRPQVVALDPIRKFHRQDENDSTAITRVVDRLDALIEEFGVTFLLTHHSGHPFQGAPPHMRGSSVWGDESDCTINLSKPIQNNNTVIRVKIEDVRHTEAPPHFDLNFIPETHCFEART